MKNILVPTDFSKQAKYALDFAAVIAKKASAKIKLVHVLEVPSSSSLHVTGEVESDDPMEKIFTIKLIESSERRLAELAASVSGVKVETHIHSGSPFKVLTHEINDSNVDLVVMGTSGSSGIDELTVGSNAEKMVRHSTSPVITVKSPIMGEIKNIVFASDFAEDQPALVEQLKLLQTFFGAKLHVVKINTPHDFHASHDDVINMDTFIKKYKLENTSRSIYNDLSEEEGIMHYANDIKADLIAMGTSGRTGLGHFFLGSIAEDIVNHAKRPVWTYRLHK
ncbi:MAG: universal stress protein [Imperialibacter sp.]|uniref:universal stress protein n=1 Tax=Imperialibacter sp. TaxID=2038411 RepID=UPI0032ED8C2B